jgi:sugar phosphate isomerase/epimerase
MKRCVPSWQFPGSWLANLEKLADIDWIDGVELLFFDFGADARALFERERKGIADFAERFSYSLHLPDPLAGEAVDLVEATSDFVDLYVFHPWRGDVREPGFDAWARTVGALRAVRGARRFAMEYTGEPEFSASLGRAPDTPICADTGRLVRDGEDPAAWIEDRAASIAEIHLHTARGGKDHFPLSGDEPWGPGLVRGAAAADWRVVFETFSFDDSAASYEKARRWLQ